MIRNHWNIFWDDGWIKTKNGRKTYASCASHMSQLSLRFWSGNPHQPKKVQWFLNSAPCNILNCMSMFLWTDLQCTFSMWTCLTPGLSLSWHVQFPMWWISTDSKYRVPSENTWNIHKQNITDSKSTNKILPTPNTGCRQRIPEIFIKYNNAKWSIPVHPTFVNDGHLLTVTSKINRVYHG